MNLSLYSTRLLTGLSLSAVVALTACGENKSKNDSKKSNKDEIVDTYLFSEKVNNGSVELSFYSNDDAATYQCRVEKTFPNQQKPEIDDWTYCPSALVDIPEGGSVKVLVKAISKDGRVDMTPLEKVYNSDVPTANLDPYNQNNQNQYPDNNQNQYPDYEDDYTSRAMPNVLVGTQWEFNVPVGMHIVQYASSVGIGGNIDILQIAPDAHSTYMSLFRGTAFTEGCPIDMPIRWEIDAPSGDGFNYCAGQVAGANRLRRVFGSAYTKNHIEVANDPSDSIETRYLVQIHDHLAPGESLVEQICMDGGHNLAGVTQVFQNRVAVEGFWRNDWLRENIRTCDVMFGGFNSGRWQIAGFSVIPNNPDARPIEVLYMEHDPSGRALYADIFARNFQDLVISTLGQSSGYLPF